MFLMTARYKRRSGPARPGRVSWRQARLARARLASGADLSRQERRRLRAQIRLRDTVTRSRGRQTRRIGLALAGAVAVMAVVAVAFALGPAIAAARGQGAVGTFTVDSRVCSRGCSWVGTFVARGGQVTPGVAYEGSLPAGAGPGSSIPAIYPGGYHAVFAPHGSLAWLGDLLLVVLIGSAMAVALWISPIGTSGRRRREIRRSARAA
jgi:hypothetical protein